MSEPIKQPNGKWKIQIQVNGKRKAKRFDTKQAAKQWAALMMTKGVDSTASGVTLKELADIWLERWCDSTADPHRNRLRLKFLLDGTALGNTKLTKLDQVAIATWRDEQLKRVEPGTVLRDWNLLQGICTKAVDDLGMMAVNPFKLAKRPKQPPARVRIPSAEEIERLDYALQGTCVHGPFLFACETGMSAGEIAALTWDMIQGKVATLPAFKTRPARQVPLSPKALEVLGTPGEGSVFGLTPSQLDANWRKQRNKAGITNLHFHDLRAAAATKWAKVLDPLALAKMLGHKDLKMLIEVYYRESAEAIADRMG